MTPTIRDGQHMLVNRLAYLPEVLRSTPMPHVFATVGGSLGLFDSLSRGDIVVFWHPNVPDVHLVKRVIGLPGETISARDGRIYVDGVPLAESYVLRNTSYRLAPRRLGEGELFVLGDNRNNSYDSHNFGPIPVENIVGRAIVIDLAPVSLAETFQQAVGHPTR
jgi:signal peptidase I